MIGLLAANLAACPSTPWESLRDSKDVGELRRYVRDNPKDPEISEARARIAELEYLAAKRAGSRYAYNSFLERHPESSQSIEARLELEELDYAQAGQRDDLEALEGFLRRHPNGQLADQARGLRGERQCQLWRAEPDPDRLAKYLLAQADLPCRVELLDRLKRMRLERALGSGQTDQLLEFVETYPNDPLAATAQTALLDRLTATLLDAARFDRARQLIQSRAGAQDAVRLVDRVRAAELAWLRAAFAPDPQAVRKESDRRRYRALAPLADAAHRLRSSLQTLPGRLAGPDDPRERWLLADRIAYQVDESAADALFELLSDPFLEVRRRAQAGLRHVLTTLGPIRGPVWLGEQRRRLEKTARSGILMFKLASLLQLEADPASALDLLRRLIEESEHPDLLALVTATQLATLLGLDLEAATFARRFCEAAQAYADQRTEAWSQTAALGSSDSGWLILRQIQGLLVLWSALLEPFAPTLQAPAGLPDHESLLGPWRPRSEHRHVALQRWFADEESRWARVHPGYQRCDSPDSERFGADPGELAIDGLAVSSLALAGGANARPNLRWAACCHPQPSIRQLSGQVLLAQELLRWLTPFPFCLDP